MSDVVVYPALGAYFRGLRKQQGLSQETLAQQLGVSSKQIFNWEMGANAPSSVHLVRLLHALDGVFPVVAQLIDQPGLTLAEAQLRIQEADAATLSAPRLPTVTTGLSPVVEQQLLTAYEQLQQALASLPGSTGRPVLRARSAAPVVPMTLRPNGDRLAPPWVPALGDRLRHNLAPGVQMQRGVAMETACWTRPVDVVLRDGITAIAVVCESSRCAPLESLWQAMLLQTSGMVEAVYRVRADTPQQAAQLVGTMLRAWEPSLLASSTPDGPEPGGASTIVGETIALAWPTGMPSMAALGFRMTLLAPADTEWRPLYAFLKRFPAPLPPLQEVITAWLKEQEYSYGASTRTSGAAAD